MMFKNKFERNPSLYSNNVINLTKPTYSARKKQLS